MREETKEQRFQRVVERRVNAILNGLRLLSNCSNRRMYKWDDDQLRQIWRTLDKELKRTKDSFTNIKPNRFRFRS